MHKIVVLLLITLLASVATAAPSYKFAGIEWGTPATTLTKVLAEKGFKKIVKDKDGDYTFEGELLGYKALGIALMSEDLGVVKIMLRLVTPDNKVRDAYADMKETLSSKYGKPQQTYEFFASPYYDGDGYEEQAIRVGKGHFASFWTNDDTNESLMVQISEQLTIDITYESAFWSAESKKRKTTATDVF
jgi:hypothetical protein